MLGIGVIKILFTVAVVFIVWHGFRLLKRRQAARVAEEHRRAVGRARPAERTGHTVQDTRPCPVCGAYVAVSAATPCGRADCPYPG